MSNIPRGTAYFTYNGELLTDIAEKPNGNNALEKYLEVIVETNIINYYKDVF